MQAKRAPPEPDPDTAAKPVAGPAGREIHGRATLDAVRRNIQRHPPAVLGSGPRSGDTDR